MEISMAKILLLILSLTGCYHLNCSSSVESCCKRIGTTLNCVRCGLSELPFLLMDSNVTRLDLSKNDIRIIPNGSFEHMASLKMLNVSGNPLQDLNKHSFRGLWSVEQFAIGSDYATKQWYFAEEFSSLTNVTDLRLNCLYPAHLEPGFVQHMLDTETLTIGLDDAAVFGKELSRLEGLTALHLTGDPKFGSRLMVKINLTEALLASVPQIEELTVSYVLKNVMPNSLKPLTNLKQLRLLLNRQFSTKQAFTAIKNMNRATLTHLILDGSHSTTAFAITKDMLNLPCFDNLMLISVKHTRLVKFDLSFLFMLPRLKYVSGGFNSFLAGWEELRYNVSLLFSTRFKAISLNQLYVSLPDHKFPIFRAREDNNMLYYDLSGTILPSNFSLHVGLDKLQGLNLKGCNISQMHPYRLRHFPSLVYFDLQKSRLDISYFAKTTQVRSQLRYLDLGYNHIKNLPDDLISSLTSLQSVCFRGNPLVEITLDIKNNMKLELLDCSLVNLTDSFMQQLDGLWSLQSNTTKQMRLSSSNNRFDCSCSALAMIHWFQNTHVDIINKQSIYCTDKNGSVAIVDIDFSMMSEDCKTPTDILMIILMPLASVTLLLVGIVLIHRYQWQLKWCVYKTKRRIRLALTRRNSDILLEQVQFDAFIAHDHSDVDWVTNQLYDNLTGNHKLELCLAQRDFLGGTPIAENIAHAINNSRKTVLVVTPAFVKSEWCLFEMHMAIAVKGMNHIVVILKEQVPVGKTGRTLRMILQTICYIEYPGEEAGLDLFWNKVVRAIKSQ